MSDTMFLTETLPPTPGTSSTSAPTAGSTRRALDLLAAGVPLSLLLDLASAVPSRDLFGVEVGDTTWVPHAVA